MSYPGLFMPISGPASVANSYNAIPGTALSLLAKWNPITFGQRKAAIENALIHVLNELRGLPFQ